MDILVSGCSFTHWPEEPGSDQNICWPTHLQALNPQHHVKNIAEPGAGNQYISSGVVRNICENPGRFGLVIIMWSGVSRLDFLTDIANQSWHTLFDSYGFYRRVESCPNQLGYIFSGGFLGPWTCNDATKGLFKNMYKISNNLSLAHINLMEIIKTQYFLQAKNIPYIFMSYVNYWVESKNYISPNGDFGVMGYPELQPLINEIDFDSWVFEDASRKCIYDMALRNQDFNGDRFHPGRQTHQAWADLVNQRVQSLI